MSSEHDHHDPEESHWENGERVQVADNSAEELISRCAAVSGIRFAQALVAMQFYDENYSSNDSMNAGSLAQALAERDKHWWLAIEKMFALLADYQNKQKDAPMIRMSTRALSLALGFRLVAGADTTAELARVMGLEKVFGQSGKQTVWKCHQKFVDQLKLVNVPGQRDEEAREEMSRRRLEQLKPKKAA